MVFPTLNRLKWTGHLQDCEIAILHRGAPGNRKTIRGESITEVKKSFFVFGEGGRETVIPNHRVLEIKVKKSVIWRRRVHGGS